MRVERGLQREMYRGTCAEKCQARKVLAIGETVDGDLALCGTRVVCSGRQNAIGVIGTWWRRLTNFELDLQIEVS